MTTLARFLIAGGFNTFLGYAIILAGLWLGLGDYAANAIGYALGLPIAYHLHRRWTFAARHPANWAERWRFVVSVAIAFGANLCVIWAAQWFGWAGGPFVQLLAVMTYAAVFFVLSRHVVFVDPERTRKRPPNLRPAALVSLEPERLSRRRRQPLRPRSR